MGTPLLIRSEPDRSEALSRLSRLAAALLDAPIAHVTLMVDGRQHYGGAFGLPEEVITPEGMPMSFGFCPTVVQTGEPLVRPDLEQSEFRENPAVVDHGARAYAGTPLRRGDGVVIGSFCVLDVVQRPWSKEQLELLALLAEGVITELELTAALQASSEALAESERLQAAVQERADAARVIEHISEGVVQLDEHGVVLLWNPAAAAMTGIAPSAAEGQQIRQLCSDWPAPGTGPGTIRTRAEDGGHVILVSGADWGAGSVYALRDISDEQRLTRMRDELIATISHELRTPLASIYAASITLQRQDITLDAATSASLLAMVEEQASRLTVLSDEILLASRLDQGAVCARTDDVSLVLVVREALDALMSQSELSERVLVCVDERLVAKGDAAALRRVVVNLLDNACKYSPPAGMIHVSARKLPGGNVDLVVEDQGGGVPPEDRVLIFEKFYRRDPDMRHGVGGTGLGLFICRELVHAMGGRIWAEPSADGGGGAGFHVELAAG